SWHEVSGDLPTDFGFPIYVHAHEPETVYVVPITSDSHHFPPEGKLRAYRRSTATSTCSATRCPSTPWTPAESTSAPRGARCTPRPTPGTAGRPSSVIFPPCCPSRCRRCHDRAR